MRSIPLVLLVLTALTGSATALADARLDFKSNSSSAPLTRMEIAGNLMRTDSGDNSIIVDATSQQFLTIDHGTKQYSRIDAAQMQQLADAASAAMKQAQGLLQSLPEDQRQAIEERLGIGSAAKTKVVLATTGKQEKVAGYDCEVFAMKLNGIQVQDICLADAVKLGLSAADRKGLHDAFAYFKRIAEKFSTGASQLDLPFDQIGNNRVPVKIVEYEQGKAVGISELTAVATTALPASDFSVPAGYTEQQIQLPGH